jgi:predicted nucleotidyltransferase
VTLVSTVRGLVDAGVHFVVVGGFAAAAHGSARLTDDVDICYDTAPDNILRLGRLLAEWHAYPRGIEPGLPFIMDARTLRSAPIQTLTTSQGSLDLMDVVKGVGDYAKCRAASEEVTVGDVQFRLLTLPALIRAKRAAGRPKDIDHLVELEAIAETIAARKRS